MKNGTRFFLLGLILLSRLSLAETNMLPAIEIPENAVACTGRLSYSTFVIECVDDHGGNAYHYSEKSKSSPLLMIVAMKNAGLRLAGMKDSVSTYGSDGTDYIFLR